jgi:hypothetical protein
MPQMVASQNATGMKSSFLRKDSQAYLAFQALRDSMMDQINAVLQQTGSFDYNRLVSDISISTWLKHWVGCAAQPDSYQQLVAELQRNHSGLPDSDADLEVRRLNKAHRLFVQAKSQLNHDSLDIVRLVKATRRIETLCQVMLTKN